MYNVCIGMFSCSRSTWQPMLMIMCLFSAFLLHYFLVPFLNAFSWYILVLIQIFDFLKYPLYSTRVLGGDQGRFSDEADMVLSALETSLFQAQRTQTVLRKRHKGKEITWIEVWTCFSWLALSDDAQKKNPFFPLILSDVVSTGAVHWTKIRT